MNKRSSIVLISSVAFLLSSFSFKNGPFPGIKTVVIDAGHGGKDPGCHGVSYKEKDVALAVALKLGRYIEENCKDVKVIYTRKTDVFVELNQRAAIANKANADLFICIHCNASPNKTAFGSETYVMGLHKTKGNLDIAKRENASILMEDDYQKKYEGFDPNSDEATIIFTMYQNAYLEQSSNLAFKIQKYYKDKATRVDKGVHQAGFLVLWKTKMPSLLTEIGFLTNSREEKIIGSEKGQDYTATSLFLAFREYKNEMEGNKMKYNDELENKEPYKFSPLDTMSSLQSVVDTLAGKRDTAEVKVVKADTIKKAADIPVKEIKSKISYRVQIASSDKKLPLTSDKFKGIEDVKEYQDDIAFRYTAGDLETMSKANSLQKELRKKGFPGAFVVVMKDGKRISLSEIPKETIKPVKPPKVKKKKKSKRPNESK